MIVKRILLQCGTLAALAMMLLAAPPAIARDRDAAGFIAALPAPDRKAFEEWLAARTFFDADLDAYWAQVESKRSQRRKKRSAGSPLTPRDYVTDFPPQYKGPALDKRLAKAWEDYQKAGQPPDAKPPDAIPGLDEYMSAAKRYYGFTPERVSERTFKERYAREALRLGLSALQVVRVYALETGGIGTAEMQAGIHPLRKTGKPISSALGYAQLLAANTVGELAKHGPSFIARLEAMAEEPGISSDRRNRLELKITALKKMVARVRSVPNNWSNHQAYARTGPGMGVHVVNIDGDIGPWLQVIKLKGIKEFAQRHGRSRLTPEELELMNLAGPGTGLEMMSSVGTRMPTSNFFSRRGYYRNSIVRGKTGGELLTALGDRMDANIKNSGAQEFLAVFEELKAGAGDGRQAGSR